MKKYLLIVLILIGLLGIYGHYFETQRITVNTIKIRNDAFSKVLRNKTIVFVSDLHFADSENMLLNSIINKVSQIKPDLICLGGDYVEWFATESAYRQAEHFLALLKAPLGVFAVMGDADYTLSRFSCLFCHAEGTADKPRNHPVQFLKNERKEIKIGSEAIRITGLHTDKDLSFDDSTLRQNLQQKPTILLSHSSLIYNSIPNQTNVLVLSGDTHGGQIYLPIWMWKILRRKPDPEHMYGYFHDGNKHLFVSNGIGTTDLDVRIGVPPQITVFKFLAEKEVNEDAP